MTLALCATSDENSEGKRASLVVDPFFPLHDSEIEKARVTQIEIDNRGVSQLCRQR